MRDYPKRQYEDCMEIKGNSVEWGSGSMKYGGIGEDDVGG